MTDGQNAERISPFQQSVVIENHENQATLTTADSASGQILARQKETDHCKETSEDFRGPYDRHEISIAKTLLTPELRLKRKKLPYHFDVGIGTLKDLGDFYSTRQMITESDGPLVTEHWRQNADGFFFFPSTIYP